MLRPILIVAMGVAAVPAFAQWQVSGDGRIALAAGRNLMVAVNCSPGPVVSIRFTDDGVFAAGLVVAQFDTRQEPLDIAFTNQGQQLNGGGSAGAGREFIGLLRSANTVLLAVGRAGEALPVAETISLRGSGTAIGGLPCVR